MSSSHLLPLSPYYEPDTTHTIFAPAFANHSQNNFIGLRLTLQENKNHQIYLEIEQRQKPKFTSPRITSSSFKLYRPDFRHFIEILQRIEQLTESELLSLKMDFDKSESYDSCSKTMSDKNTNTNFCYRLEGGNVKKKYQKMRGKVLFIRTYVRQVDVIGCDLASCFRANRKSKIVSKKLF